MPEVNDTRGRTTFFWLIGTPVYNRGRTDRKHFVFADRDPRVPLGKMK